MSAEHLSPGKFFDPAAVATRDVPYRDGDTSLTGVLAWDDSQSQPRPGILLIHGGAGLDEHAREQARRYAEVGYAVLACDLYGAGVAGDRARVMACINALRGDPDLLAGRLQAGLAALAGCAQVSANLAAIGFCFGGLGAHTLARSGAELSGVVSIHGSLSTNRSAAPGAIGARILVCHGASDPHIPMTDVVAFADEMTRAGADWQLIMYGGVVHGFTHRHAVPGAADGVAYDQPADERSFAATVAFLAELNPLDRAGI